MSGRLPLAAPRHAALLWVGALPLIDMQAARALRRAPAGGAA